MRRQLSSRRGRGNVGIPKGFPKSVGRVGSRLLGFPCFPYSVISTACFSPGRRWVYSYIDQRKGPYSQGSVRRDCCRSVLWRFAIASTLTTRLGKARAGLRSTGRPNRSPAAPLHTRHHRLKHSNRPTARRSWTLSIRRTGSHSDRVGGAIAKCHSQ